ncbi:MAG: endonuclease III domain-containing protein [Candidatus Dormibacteraceae bacterium]
MHAARPALLFRNPYELLVAIILSAQTTDRRVNELTPALFSRYPNPDALAGATLWDLESLLRPIGFYRIKSKTIRSACRALVERYGGTVPTSMADLLTLPGVGRKTANAFLVAGLGQPGIVTDRHLIRVAGRLALVDETEPERVERMLMRLLPRRAWGSFSLRMTLHGRAVCLARRPRCERCVLNDFCPSSTTRDWPTERRLALALSFAPPPPRAPGSR